MFLSRFTVTEYYNTSQQILVSCILSVSVLTLLSSVVATLISAGYPRERLEFLRHYAVFNIVSCEHISKSMVCTCRSLLLYKLLQYCRCEHEYNYVVKLLYRVG